MELTYGPDGNVLSLTINRPAIETAVVGGVKLPKGAVLVDKDDLDALEAHDAAVCEALDTANNDLEEVREELSTVKGQLAAAKATSLLGEHTLFPLNADGISTPPENPDCFCYIVFPNMRRRVLICNLPVNAGETLRFGDLDLAGYSVVIERRAKASPVPGGKPSMGYSLSIQNRAGQNFDIEFVPDHAFHERLSDHQKDPIYMGGKVFRGTFQMKRYTSYPEALAMLLRDEMIEVLKRDGYKSPQEVANMISAARQLPATSAKPMRDEDRIQTRQLPAKQPPAPPPEAIAASQVGGFGKSPSDPPPPSDPAVELGLDEEELEKPAGDYKANKQNGNPAAAAPPSI